MTWQLRERFEPQLEVLQLARLFHDVEMPLVHVLAEMEWTGITIDVDWFASLKERFERERKRVEQEIYAVAGEEFNINSNPQLREILFDKLKLPVLKKTSTGRVDRRQRAAGARRGRASAARAAHGVSRAVEAREHVHRRATGLRPPEDRAPPHVVQPDRGRHRTAVVERSESSEYSNPPRAGPRHSARIHSAEGLDAPRRRLLADRASSARPSVGRSGVRAAHSNRAETFIARRPR